MAIALVAALLAAPAGAAGADFSDLYRDYRGDGEIDGCRYSEADLRDAEQEVPPDVEQYAPNFVDALASAREKRSRGECEKKPAAPPPAAAAPAAPPPGAAPPAAAAPAAPPAAAPPAAVVPVPRAPAREVVAGVKPPEVEKAAASGEDGFDAWPLLVAAAAVLVLVMLMFGISRFFGWSAAERLRPLRAAAADAGERTADWAAEFLDWVRLGR